MQSGHRVTPLAPLGCLDELQQLVRNSLLGNWVIRIEYAATNSSTTHGWRTWGKPLFAVRDSSTVVEAIHACRASNPNRAIRINAECLNPRTRLMYRVDSPQDARAESQTVPTVLEPAARVLHTRLPATASRMRAVVNAVWRYAALGAVLLMSVLLVEEAVLT